MLSCMSRDRSYGFDLRTRRDTIVLTALGELRVVRSSRSWQEIGVAATLSVIAGTAIAQPFDPWQGSLSSEQSAADFRSTRQP
jgi:hypothetical protein